MRYLEMANSAEVIGLPKGENCKAYRQEFEDATGIEVPITRSGRLSAASQGRKFYFVRGMDMPARVASADIDRIDLGVAGSDAYLEYGNASSVEVQEIGATVCWFSVLATSDKVSDIEALLSGDRRRAGGSLSLPTSYPRMLNMLAAAQDLPLMALDVEGGIGGGVEAYAELTGIGAVADIVQTYKTATANGLQEVVKLRDIYTTLMWKAGNESL